MHKVWQYDIGGKSSFIPPSGNVIMQMTVHRNIVIFSGRFVAHFFRENFLFFFKSQKMIRPIVRFLSFLLLALFLHLISAAITMIIGRPIYSLAFSDCIFSAPGGHFLRPPRLNIHRALYLIFLFFFFFLPKFGAKFKVVIFG